MAQFAFLHGLTISFTNVESASQRDELERKILKLGGRYLKNFSTTSTTHLISNTPKGPKYTLAKEINIPCLLPSFVEECWMKAHLGNPSSKADMESLLKKHSIPPLHRLRISLTGFSCQERKELSTAIISAGGTYSPELRMETTHLILKNDPPPLRRSPKLEYAKKWNIPVINGSSWLLESINKGVLLEVAKPYEHDCEGLLDENRDNSVKSNNINSRNAIVDGSLYQERTNELSLDDLKIMSANNELDDLSYFAQMHFYLPPTSKKLPLLRKLILLAGGTRHANLSYDQDMITHCVVCDQTISAEDLPKLQSLRLANPKVLFVHDEYLFACLSARAMIDPTEYSINVDALFDKNEIGGAGAGADDHSDASIKQFKRKTFGSINSGCFNDDKVSSTLSQTSVPVSSQNCSQPNISKKPKIQKCHLESIRIALVPHLQQHNIQQHQVPLQFSPSKKLIFRGKFFTFKYFDNDFHQSELVDLLESNGATIFFDDGLLSSSPPMATATLATTTTIVPMFLEKSAPIPNHCRTEHWISCSLAAKEMIESESPLFKPFICANNSYKSLLKEEILSLTGFEGWERSWYSLLIKSSSGTCTDNLSKRNTLLVYDDPSKRSCKLDFAVSIKMPIIQGSSLLEAFKAGMLSLESGSVGLPNTTTIATAHNTIVNTRSSKPLQGYLISISQFLYSRRVFFENLIDELGGSFLLRWDQSATHFITDDSGPTDRELEEMQSSQTKICSSSWLIEMKQRGGLWVDEFGSKAAPAATSPLSLDARQQSMPVIDYSILIEEDKKRQRKTNVIEYDLKASISNRAAISDLSSSTSLLTATTTTTTTVGDINYTSITRKKVIFANNSRQSRGQRKINVEGLYALGVDVALDDSFVSGEVEHGTEGIGSDVTHLVVCVNDRLIASEKLLSAISKGMWVLQYQWLLDSLREGMLVDEEPYQWSSNKIGQKAIEWRKHLLFNDPLLRKGRFDGWRLLLLRKSDSPTPKEINQTNIAYRVLKLGGAVIVEEGNSDKDDDADKDAYHSSITHIAYAFDKNLLLPYSTEGKEVFSISEFQSYLI